ncbi:MAG: hypothetical protein ABI837_17250 [Acidobacteriota bacterium]
MIAAQVAVVATTAGLAGLSWLVWPATALVRLVLGADSTAVPAGPTAALTVAAIVLNVVLWFALSYGVLTAFRRVKSEE